MIQDALKQLGLSDNESKVYLSLLKKGRLKASELISNTKIVSSQIYTSLELLLDKGLVTYQKTAKHKIYEAVDPKIIQEILKEQQKNIYEAIPLLKNLRVKEEVSTDTAVYEGVQGFKTALYNAMNHWPEKAEVKIIGFSAQSYKNSQLANILRDVNKSSKLKKHKFRIILDNKNNPFIQSRMREGISQIRFMEKGFVSPAAIDICNDNVNILMWDEKPYVFSITNKNIAEGFHSYFEFLWKISKK